MRVADSDYILALHNGARVVNYATFTLHDGTVLNLQPADFRISGNTFTDKTTDGNSFTVGSFIGKTANICIDNSTGKFDGYDFYMSRFILKESVAVGNNIVKHVSIGNFTVVTDVTPGSVISFSAVDDTYLFDKVHNLSGTKTLKEIIQQACTQCLGSPTFDGTGNFALHNTQIDTNKLDAKLTWRQIVSYVAIMTGNNAYIDVNEILKFKWYDFSVFDDGLDGGTFDTNTTPYSDGDTADGGDFTFSESTNYDGGTFTDTQDYHIIQSYKGFNIGTYDISITGVRVVNGDTVVEKPSSHQYNYSYVIEVKDNPLCAGIENTVATHLASILNDLTFRIFSCGILCNPLIEAGDMALVIDTKGIAHRTIINDVTFTTGGFTQVACKAENIIRQQSSYTSEAAKAVVEANRNTERQLSSYDESVQRMNRLSQNSSGMYTARVLQQDGSYIYYSSDHEITYNADGSAKFTAGSFVAKDAGAGYFYSTNAGVSDATTTWAGGIDRAGNAVLNTLALYKLQAEWVVAGILSDRLAYNYWDLDNNILRIVANTKIYDNNSDYSGAYIPTNDNVPAQSWTTDALKRLHIGQTFLNTNSKITYIYKQIPIAESGHPYAHNSDDYYQFNTGLTAPIKISFDENSITEATYDYIDLYYELENVVYTKRLTGSIGAEEIVIPTNTFYLHFHSDSSVDNWGWRINSIGETNEEITTFQTGTLPTVDWNVINGIINTVWEEASIVDYISNNITQEEAFNAITNNGTARGIFAENGEVYINATYIKGGIIEVGGKNYDKNASFRVRDTEDNIVGTWNKDGFTANKGQFGILHIDQGTPPNYDDASIYAGTYREYVYEKEYPVRTKQGYSEIFYINPYKMGFTEDTSLGVFFGVDAYYPEDYTPTAADLNQSVAVVYLDKRTSLSDGYSQIGSVSIKLSEQGVGKEILDNYGHTLELDHTFGQNLGESYRVRAYFDSRINSGSTVYRSYIDKATFAIHNVEFMAGVKVSLQEVIGNFKGGLVGSADLYSLKCGNVESDGDGLTVNSGSGSGNGIKVYNGSNDIQIYTTSVDANIVKHTSTVTYVPQWSQVSDRRLKDNIEPLNMELSKALIDGSEPIRFNYIEEDGKHYGMIAQDVRKQLDRLGEKDAQLEFIMNIPKDMQKIPDQRAICYEEYIPHLINYVKELRAEIDGLKEEIKSLKGE